ncbi:ribosome biogenesis protein ytm1 [Malassezia yamatoensis]|uniref:Ribosome biogenesis protein ytm1 n=1 Tax=Malassezia yamatoensis TaxID=253288 RepID=A0AAJ5YP56_9BASI|nr:ribosome biogenesis protein ytm1 [Malassezia yamatoensis]
MGVEDVGTFLASVGSPLVQGNDAKKVLPASAVLQLLNAQIETLKSSETRTETKTSEPTPSPIELDEELKHALIAYAKATAQYFYTSAVPALAAPLVDASKRVIGWRQALASKDYAVLPDRILACQNALQHIGIQLDLLNQHVDLAETGSMSRSATVRKIATMTKTLLNESHDQLMHDWKEVMHVTNEKTRVDIKIESLATASEHSSDAWLAGMWKLVCAMNHGKEAINTICAMLESRIIEPILDQDQHWQLLPVTNGASTAEIHVQVREGHAEKLDGASVKALIAILGIIHDKFLLPCSRSLQENSEWASTQNLLTEIPKRIVPRLLASFKSYLLRGLPKTELSLQQLQSTSKAIQQIAIQFHTALLEFNYAREASRSLSKERNFAHLHTQPRSDLDQWTAHISTLLYQQRQGNVLSDVRTNILRTDDKAWDSITIKSPVQIAELSSDEPRALPKIQRNLPELANTQKTASIRDPPIAQQEAIENQQHNLLQESSFDTPTPVPTSEVRDTSKRRKKTLGAVQRLGAAPSSSKGLSSVKDIAVPKAATDSNENKPVSAPTVRERSKAEPEEDDWGWGDDDEVEMNEDMDMPTEPQIDRQTDDWDLDDPWDDNAEESSISRTTLANHKQQATPTPDSDKKTGWNSGDEVENLLEGPQNATIEPSKTETHQSAFSGDAANEDSFDAWDWNDSEGEVELCQSTAQTKGEVTSQKYESERDTQKLQMETVSHVVTQRCLAINERIQKELDNLSIEKDTGLLRNVCDSILESYQLYRALMPVTHASSLQHVPILTMLFSNDCVHIANLIHGKINPKLSKLSTSKEVSNLMHALEREAEKLQELSTLWQAAQLDLQMYSLQECLDQADGFVKTDQDARNVACERVIAQVDHILQHLLKVWKPVVTRGVLIELMGKLVQAVYTRVQADIEQLEDISEVESHRLAALCRTLLEAQTAMFAHAADCDAESAGALAATVVPSWFKFSYLPELLTGALADIEYLLFDSGGALLDYETEEITALIRALFADTTNRRRLLDRVQRSL